MKACAIVSGAGSGIGKAVAEKFLSENYEVILIGRRIEALKEIEKAFSKNAFAISCDLRSDSDLKALENHLKAKNNLEILINNAGIYEQKSFLSSEPQDFLKMFESNFLSCVRLTKIVVPFFQKNKKGVIVNISSTLGRRPVAGTSAYSASKAAMINLTQSLALEFAPSQIRVNCVCPGLVDTPIHGRPDEKTKSIMQTYQPLGRMGRPEEIAHHVFGFCTPGSEWTTGSILEVDGGIHL